MENNDFKKKLYFFISTASYPRLLHYWMLAFLFFLWHTTVLYGQTAPGNVSGFSAWYKSDAGLTATTWADQSANAYSLTRPTDPNDERLINYTIVPRFNGDINHIFSSTADPKPNWPVAAATGHTYYYVARNTRASNIRSGVIGIGNSNTTATNGFHSGDNGSAIITSTGNGSLSGTSRAFVSSPPDWSAPNLNLVRTGHGGSANNRNYASTQNGVEGTGSTATTPNYSDATPFRIGGLGSGDRPWEGEIAEVIVYPGKHTAADYDRVESYLAIKWGITKAGNYLASDNTIWWDATANSGYLNNIAGIGRDDNSALLQKQAKSENNDFQLIFSKGILAATNQANTAVLANDRSALLWGDNGLGVSLSESFPFGGLKKRMGRIWKTQELGGIGTVEVYVPTSAAPATAISFSLLLSTDEVFDGTDNIIPMSIVSIDGASYYTASVSLSGSQYISLGADLAVPGGVANAQVWLRSDDGTASGLVPNWVDVINGHVFTSSGFGGDSPTLTEGLVNFNPSLVFNNDELTSDVDASVSTDNTLEVVAVAATSDPAIRVISFHGPNSSSTKLALGTELSTNRLLVRESTGSGEGQYDLSTNITVEKPSILGFNMYNATTTFNQLESFQNLLQLNESGAGAGTTVANIASTRIRIGRWRNTSNNVFFPFIGNIAEYIVFDAPLSPADRQRVNTYLAIKYGITLAEGTATHYLASDGTTQFWTGDATYQNNIGGIARDDASSLHQKQAKSQNEGGQPIVSMGNLALTNQANSANISADKSALLWGSNLAAVDFATSFAFLDMNIRMDRVWKVQETGTIGNVNIYLPASLVPSTATDVHLLVSTDDVFDGSDNFIAMATETVEGIDYYKATIDFSTGQFFSFGLYIPPPPCGGSSTDYNIVANKQNITLSTTASTSGSINRLKDGLSQTNFYYSGTSQNVANKEYVRMQFPEPVLLKGFELSAGAWIFSSGTIMNVEGSHDGTNWDVLLAKTHDQTVRACEFGTCTRAEFWLFPDNATLYTYYRLRGVSGTSRQNPWVYELYFDNIAFSKRLTNLAYDNNGTSTLHSDDMVTFDLNPIPGTGTYALSVDGGFTLSPSTATYGAPTSFTVSSGSTAVPNLSFQLFDESVPCVFDFEISNGSLGVDINQANCTGPTDSPLSEIIISGDEGVATRAGYSEGAVYTGPGFSTATAIDGESVDLSLGYTLATALANPASTTYYSVRTFLNETSFKDYVLTLDRRVCSQADLSLQISPATASANEAENLVYTVTLTNNGPDPAVNVIVKVDIPSGLDVVTFSSSLGEYSPNTQRWRIAEIPVGAQTLQITYKMK